MSEPMVFGLGAGLGFNYMERCDRKTGLHEPLVFCTTDPGEISKSLGEILGPKLVLEETVSRSEARTNLFRRLDNGKPYGLKLDRFYLDYAERKAHFNAHYLTACGYDESHLFVVDVGSSEIRRSAFQSIERARSTKGFMSSKNLGFYYDWRPLTAFESAFRGAVLKTVTNMLYGPSSFDGIRGMERFAERIRGWPKNPNFRYQLMNHYLTWEGEGEARGGFRKLYAEFLEEMSIIMNNRELGLVGESFRTIAQGWTEIDDRLRQLCLEQGNSDVRLIEGAKAIKKQAKLEAQACRELERVVTC